MRHNPVKHTLRAGQKSLGHMVFEFSTTGIARIVATTGAEFVIYDMEHTGWSMETIRMLLATSRSDNGGPAEGDAAAPVPMVRVPATEYHFLARVLDMGAMGLMVPMVESVEQARLIVNSTKYPPAGRRGAAFVISHDDFRAGDAVGKMRSANEEILLIAQIETARGLENVEAIAAVDGIDVLWVGHNDLTNSMGIPGQFDHARYLDAIARILDASRRHGKAAGIMATSVAIGKSALSQGFRMLAYGGDLWLYQQAVRDGLAALRTGT
jgi:2-dehydro-3-deoxyglucarate aldolase/4-hydroxy-2-oxoheptanedioate aldolase